MRSWFGRLASMTGVMCAVAYGLAAAGASAAPSLRVVGDVARVPHSARILGPLESGTRIDATVALQPRDAAALARYATAVSTPGDALWGHFLTARQFSARFGAGAAAVAAVEADLRAAGVRISAVPADHLMVEVTGTAAEIERAFDIGMFRVRVAGRTAYANDEAPAVPARIARYVQGVIGLDSLDPQQPQDLVRLHLRARQAAERRASVLMPHAVGSGPAPCPEASALNAAQNSYGGAGDAYTADEIASMYGFESYYAAGDEGAGQTVALVEEQPFQPTDISTYEACYGLPTTAPTVINVDGGPGAYGSGDDDGEAALDIEQVIGLAPKATIDVYQSPDPGTAPTAASDILAKIVSDDQAKVISSSYGACEALTGQSVINSENTLLQEAATQGQSFFISSGDSGAEMCFQATREQSSPDYDLSVIDPGAQPFATGVGGTTLGSVVDDGGGESVWNLPQNGAYPTESVWNDGLDSSGRASGTGGGVSDQWAMPSYQSNAAGALDVISSSSSRTCGGQLCREVPDVSADADPNSGYAIYANGGTASGGWGGIGGTSAAAPMWAAMTALFNASSACRGLSLGFVNPALYSIAGSTYLADFHDITAASPFSGAANNDTFTGDEANGIDPSDLYPVSTGYDMATGLGTPIAGALGASLCALRSPRYTVSVASPGTPVATVGGPVSLQIAGSDSGNATLTYTASGLPAGLTISAGGLITGTPTTAGTSTVTVTASDAYTNSGAVSFTWTVVPAPAVFSVTRASLGGVTGRAAKLSFTVHSSPSGVQAIAVALPAGVGFATGSAKKLARDLSVRAGSRGLTVSVHVSGSKLEITLPRAQSAVSVVLSKLRVAKSLQRRVRAHKVRKVKFAVGLTNANGTRTLTETVRV